jgi:methionine biosynthesis protein MetW
MAISNGKPEYPIIANMIKPDTAVLDLGCGDGGLLALLRKERGVNRGQGIEIDEQAIHRCVARGLSVFHGDIDSGLAEYSDQSFDYVILNQTFQQVKKPDEVLSEALRVGKEVIVGLPNFAHISARYQLAILGKAPVTPSLPYEWYNTPNLHFLSIADFINYCRKRNINIEKAVYLAKHNIVKLFPNIFALVGVFLIARGTNTRQSTP